MIRCEHCGREYAGKVSDAADIPPQKGEIIERRIRSDEDHVVCTVEYYCDPQCLCASYDDPSDIDVNRGGSL